jgi:spermidine synthase
VLGGYALLFWLDLHHVYRIAVAAVALAALLLTRPPASTGWRSAAASAGLALPVLAALLLLGPWDPERLSAGLFRRRQPVASTYMGPDVFFEQSKLRTIYYDDDPTTSVAVYESPIADGGVARSIITNGKSDGSTELDLTTTVMLAILPALFAEAPERFFLIGWGTGITAGELAALDSTREVVVAEISQGVVDAAPLFDFANRDASRNPKLQIIRSDAYRALLRSEGVYDAIISEPPNPWVTGTEMLYSREFLEAARDLLSPRGVYAQWFHQYETNSESVELVFHTYAEVFGHVAVWYAKGPDLILLGFKDPSLALDVERLERRATRPDFAAALHRAKITSFPALLASELLPLGVIHAAKLSGPIHTLYHPRLNAQASRGFFRGARAALPFTGQGEAARIGSANSLLRRYAALQRGQLSEAQRAAVVSHVCASRPYECATFLAKWSVEQPGSETASRAMTRARAMHPADAQVLGPQNLRLLRQLFAAEERKDPILLAKARRADRLFTSHYAHNAPFPADGLVRIWRRCQARGGRDADCRRGLQNAQALAAGREFQLPGPGDALGIRKKAEEAEFPLGAAAAPIL